MSLCRIREDESDSVIVRTVLLWAAPDDGVVGVLKEEADAHNCNVINVDWGPALSGLMNLLALEE